MYLLISVQDNVVVNRIVTQFLKYQIYSDDYNNFQIRYNLSTIMRYILFSHAFQASNNLLYRTP
jgi:hypothetical protein